MPDTITNVREPGEADAAEVRAIMIDDPDLKYEEVTENDIRTWIRMAKVNHEQFEIVEDGIGKLFWSWTLKPRSRSYQTPTVTHLAKQKISYEKAGKLWNQRLRIIAAQIGKYSWKTIWVGLAVKARHEGTIACPDYVRHEIHPNNSRLVRYFFEVLH